MSDIKTEMRAVALVLDGLMDAIEILNADYDIPELSELNEALESAYQITEGLQ